MKYGFLKKVGAMIADAYGHVKSSAGDLKKEGFWNSVARTTDRHSPESIGETDTFRQCKDNLEGIISMQQRQQRRDDEAYERAMNANDELVVENRESKSELTKARGLNDYLKEQIANSQRILVGGFRAIAEDSRLKGFAIAVADNNQRIYLSPLISTRFLGEKLKGTYLGDGLEIDFYGSGFHRKKISGNEYVVSYHPIDLKNGTKNYFVIFTTPLLKEKVIGVAKGSKERAVGLVEKANQTLEAVRREVEKRLEKRAPELGLEKA